MIVSVVTQDSIGDRPVRPPLAQAYAQHAEAVRRAAYAVVRDRELADDVTQDVFLAVWLRPDRFDPERGTFLSLLRVMARSRALDAARHGRAGERARDRLKAEVVTRAAPDPAEIVIAAGRARELRGAVARLPVEQRASVGLAYWGDLTADQVATHHRVPHGTAKSRIRIGLSKLRRELDGAAA